MVLTGPHVMVKSLKSTEKRVLGQYSLVTLLDYTTLIYEERGLDALALIVAGPVAQATLLKPTDLQDRINGLGAMGKSLGSMQGTKLMVYSSIQMTSLHFIMSSKDSGWPKETRGTRVSFLAWEPHVLQHMPQHGIIVPLKLSASGNANDQHCSNSILEHCRKIE